jgi:hypothetical protein
LASHAHEQNAEHLTDRLTAGSLMHGLVVVGGGVGVLGLAVAALVALLTEGGWTRFGFAYLTNFAFFLSLALAALCFIAIQHVTRSAWSVTVRRLWEILAGALPVFAVLFLPLWLIVILGHGNVYPWAQPVPAEFVDGSGGYGGHAQVEAAPPPYADVANPDDAAHGAPGAGAENAAYAVDYEAGGEHKKSKYDALTHKKRPYLNANFFTIRWIFYFALWIGLARFLLRTSRKQDHSREARLSVLMEKVSAPALVLFALVTTFAAFDLVKSLDPHWFSTIFGVYYFAGGMLGFFSLTIIALALLKRRGYLETVVNREHQHDLGKWLFVFVFFWGYIAFSQYMLIWYGNIPEETLWFAHRGADTASPNPWSGVLLALLFGHLLIPFAGLLSRHVKRRFPLLVFWSVWLLVFHWIDIWWLVMPAYDSHSLVFGVPEIATFLGIGGLFLAGVGWVAGDKPLVPLGDPRLPEALHFQNM